MTQKPNETNATYRTYMKNDDGMSGGMRKALREIRGDKAGLLEENERNLADIKRLEFVENEIVDLYGDDEEEKPKRRKQGKGKTKVAPETNGANGDGRGRGFAPHIQAVVSQAGKLPEPITMEALHVASGADKKLCSNVIVKLAAKGWIERAGRGEYRRTSLFATSE